jgi:putative phosphoesterase
MTRLGVVGDIHGNLAGLRTALSQMGRLDGLLFTGDGYRELRELETDRSLTVIGVAGNCDFCSSYPDEQLIKVADYQLFLTHGHCYGVKQGLTRLALAGQAKAADLVIFGHTHQPLDDCWQKIRLFNPGSLSRNYSGAGSGYGIIELDQAGIRTGLYRL